MSSSSTSGPSSTTSSAPSSTSTSSGGGSGTSNSLYLFTFLTTLLLLLTVSCGIVLRSFILRRRFRRRVEAAIAAGVLLPEQVEALRRRGPVIGERPTLWEVRIGKGGKDAAGAALEDGKPGYEIGSKTVDEEDGKVGTGEWANVMPVSAAIIPAHSKKTPPAGSPANAPISPSSAAARTDAPDGEDLLHSSRRPRLLRFARTNSSALTLPMTAAPPPPSSLPSANGLNNSTTAARPGSESTPTSPTTGAGGDGGHDRLQLTVLIAMPNPNVSRYSPSMSQAAASTGADPSVDGDITAVEPDSGRTTLPSPNVTHVHEDDEDDEEIPEVVFGITEVLWDAGVDWTPRAAAAGKDDADSEDNGRPSQS